MWDEAAVVYFTKLSHYLHSTRCVNYEKSARSQGQKVEPGVSHIRKKSAATRADIRFKVQFKSGSKRPVIKKYPHKWPIYVVHIIAKNKAVVREEQKQCTSSSYDDQDAVGRSSNTCDKRCCLYGEASKNTKWRHPCCCFISNGNYQTTVSHLSKISQHKNFKILYHAALVSIPLLLVVKLVSIRKYSGEVTSRSTTSVRNFVKIRLLAQSLRQTHSDGCWNVTPYHRFIPTDSLAFGSGSGHLNSSTSFM